MKPIVFYHYPCMDGFTAAWAIWLKHPDWEFRPLKYGDPLPDLTGRVVYFVDVTVKRSLMLEIAKVAEWVYILDHHKTAQADLESKFAPNEKLLGHPHVSVRFNMEKSGARLAWEFFHDEPVPAIVKYVEDRDLWRFTFPETKDINAYLFSFDYDFETWNTLKNELENAPELAILSGIDITRKHNKDIDELAQIQTRTIIKGYNVPIINAPYFFASDLCNKLAKDNPFAASWFYDGARRKYIFSLRSTEDGIDVSEIAKQFGGGGHKHAAGFEIYDEGKELKGMLA
jgi:uncharacterized protein